MELDELNFESYLGDVTPQSGANSGCTEIVHPPFNSSVEEQPEEELEIYKKAKRFESLKLLSGSKFSDSELRSFVEEHYGVLGRNRLIFAKDILDKLGYRLSSDVLLMLSCTKKAIIVVATAGAGKTTSLQVYVCISKLLDKVLGVGLLKPELIEGTSVSVPKILYLNYNKHNVQPISDKHRAMCSAINKIYSEDDAIDDLMDSTTVHAFCHRWLTAFSADIEIPELKIIDDATKKKLWDSIIEPRWEKFYPGVECTIDFSVLDELYNYKTESMLDWDDFFLTAKFVDSDLNEEFVKRCIKKYDSMKKSMNLLDFTDYLVLMIDVLKKHPEKRVELQKHYRLIIADENQDFTKLMNELLIQLYDPEINQLVVVGDPDQTIYAFRGVSPDNVVELSQTLPDVELLGLDINYRCPDKIVDAAKHILDMNILRFKKPIETVRTGGRIIAHPHSVVEEQYVQVMDLVKRLSPKDWSNTVITYRNNISSVIIAEELFYAGIPFTILDSYRPFSNRVFKQITGAITALSKKSDYELNKELYRFMPINQSLWTDILNVNRDDRRNHLFDIKLPGRDVLPNGTIESWNTLCRIAEIVDSQPVCDYITTLLNLYQLYYFNFIVKHGGPSMQDKNDLGLYFERTKTFYQRQMTFAQMMAELKERNVDNPAGITLSTFHGLKGLEFDYVLAIDFNDEIFPNFFGIEQKYSQNTALEEKESENRLCYVLVTRTIKEFHMFYYRSDPSLYVGILSNPDTPTKVAEPKEELVLGSVTATDEMASKMSFINKLKTNKGLV